MMQQMAMDCRIPGGRGSRRAVFSPNEKRGSAGASPSNWPIALLLLLSFYARADDWPDWQKYRATVHHPALAIKLDDLARARGNIATHDWAKDYLKKLKRDADQDLKRLTPAFIEHMIEPTTPGDMEFTPCPACRDQGKPWHPHGQWDWSVDRPDELKCIVCGTVYPNDKYPESIALHSTWDAQQTFTFFGGEPMKIFAYEKGRPSFSGNIRARKLYWITRAAARSSEAYSLTNDARYARAVRPILLRFAEVYPKYLVHVGYGEYADMDPHIAAAHIKDLPADELVYPPNKPDRQLHTGYWSAGRGTGVGRESLLIAPLLQAYDLTCDAIDPVSKTSIYADADRKQIERNLFLESTVLLTADTSINNKSVFARSSVADVGICLGEPKLVRFGLEGFNRTLKEWFLADGSTPESPAYAMMALNGIDDLPQLMRGYSDPPGYRDEKGERLEHVDLYRDPKYSQCWQMAVQTMQGDLTYPSIADTRPITPFAPRFAELIATNYPDRPEYRALLNELCDTPAKMDVAAALYLRDAASSDRQRHLSATAGDASTTPFALRDVCPPDLRIGFLRTGNTGRESLLLLSASHWGSHHHRDSLNLYYWKNGHELLSDLGYLWDHPQKSMTMRTLAHNTVLIDEQDQRDTDRGGTFEQFDTTTPGIKVMRASSNAYANAKTYRRTSAIVHPESPVSYVVDVFEVDGGQTQDFVFHGPNQKFVVDGDSSTATKPLYDLTNIRALRATQASPLRITWTIDDTMAFTAWLIPLPEEQLFIGDGWGQRDYKNTDIGKTLPYIVRRTTGSGLKRFVTVFEAHAPGKSTIQSITASDSLEIKTTHGTDVMSLSPFALKASKPDQD
jgi:hypothetical protein